MKQDPGGLIQGHSIEDAIYNINDIVAFRGRMHNFSIFY